MKQRSMSKRQFMIFVFCLAVVWGVARGIGSGWKDGLIGFAIIFGFWAVINLTRGDRFAQLRVDGPLDEREQRIGDESLALTAFTTGGVALIGAMIDASQGEFGQYAVICVVGGATFLLAQLVLPRLR